MNTNTAIVFDLDGTLIDSAPDLQAIANAVLEPIGKGDISLDEAKSFIGKGVAVFVSRMMTSRDMGVDAGLHARLSTDFAKRYEVATEHSKLYPGVLKALENLSSQGYALGMCTNKPMAPTKTVLAHFGLGEFFGAVVAGDTLSMRKPDAAPLLHCFDLLGENDGRRLYVGDSEVDVETAVNAKVDMALFTEGYRKTPIEELKHAYSFDQFNKLGNLAMDHFS